MEKIIKDFEELSYLMKNNIFLDNEGVCNLNNLLDRNKMFQFEKRFRKDFLNLYMQLVNFIAKHFNNNNNQQLIGKLQIIQWLMELLIMLSLTNSNIKLRKNRDDALWIINTSKENIKNGFSLYYNKQGEIYKNINMESSLLSETVKNSILEDYKVHLWIDNISLSSLEFIQKVSIDLINELDENKKILENKNSILISFRWLFLFIILIIILIIILNKL